MKPMNNENNNEKEISRLQANILAYMIARELEPHLGDELAADLGEKLADMISEGDYRKQMARALELAFEYGRLAAESLHYGLTDGPIVNPYKEEAE